MTIAIFMICQNKQKLSFHLWSGQKAKRLPPSCVKIKAMIKVRPNEMLGGGKF